MTLPLVETSEWLELGSSTVAEASGVRCALDPAIRPAWSGARACGPAYPVQCRPGTNLAVHAALELAPPGSVLVVDAGGDVAGYWGEVLARAALQRGLVGVVVDGGVRDVDAMAHLGFPAFARGIGIDGTGKAPEGSVGEPLQLRVPVAAGDLVVADADGVVVVPAGIVDATLVHARERRDKERAVFARIEAGESTVDIYGWRQVVDQW